MPSKPPQRVTPRALLDIRTPGDLAIAPDSSRVVYTLDEIDWSDSAESQHLYIVPVAGRSEPRQLTFGDTMESHPRWSPDGKWLAFLRTEPEPDDDDPTEEEDDESRTQVWLLPMDGLGGEADALTDAPRGVATFEWLPDSSGIVYLSEEPRPTPLQNAFLDRIDDKDDAVVDRDERFCQQIWHVDVDEKRAVLVHPGDYGIGEIAVSPDGRSLAFSTNYTGEPNDYHKVDIWVCELPLEARGSEARKHRADRKTAPPPFVSVRRLTDGPGGKYHPRWTPDGRRIVYNATRRPELSFSQPNLYSVSVLDGGDPVRETEALSGDLTGWRSLFDRQGRLHLLAARGPSTVLCRYDGKTFVDLTAGDEHVHSFDVAPDGAVAYVSSNGTDAPELYWLPAGARDAEPLTDINGDWIDSHRLADVEIVEWTSPDGTPIEGLLTLPVDYEDRRRYPLVVYAHGGPYGRAVLATTSGSFNQALAAEGFVVLAPNYRGSEGYGDDFATAARGDLGGADFGDILAGVDWAVSERIADPERVGIMGSSYGAYLVNWAVGHSERFRAAVSAFGIYSLASDFGNSDTPRWEAEYLGGAPWEQPGLYAERSPATAAASIQTPVLILHGESDTNTFITNSHELYTALRLQGKTAQYVRYPREGHGFSEPRHRLDEIRRTVAWFRKHLAAPGEAPVYRVGDRVPSDGWELQVVHTQTRRYDARGDGGRFLHVELVIRDTAGRNAPLRLGPGDFSLARQGARRPIRPVGLPVDLLGTTVLAEGSGWRFDYQPDPDTRQVAAPAAVAFRIGPSAGRYELRVKEFAPVVVDISAET